MSAVETREVGDGEAGMRLDRWFRQHYPDLGHGRLQKLLRTGQIRVDGRRVKADLRLATGQRVRVPPLAPAAPRRHPAVSRADEAALKKAILYRDDEVLVIDKPPGLAVQGGSKTSRHLDGMLDALRLGSAERPRLVHRLDRDTSGVLLLARTAAAARWLTAAFRHKNTQKLYWACVAGVPEAESGRIDLALAKRPGRQGERMVPDAEDGQTARTLYRVVDRAGTAAAWLALMPVTGRTHQLRAHCEAIGHPILGDAKYGGPAAEPPAPDLARRLHLHAREIRLVKPDGGVIQARAPLPAHMRDTWAFLGFADANGPGLEWFLDER